MAALAAAMVAMGTPSKCKPKEEKIFVTVRVRPMSAREITQRDTCDWECPDEHTVAFKPPQPERSPYPARYSFDRVFGPDSTTRVVYEQGAKDVALSALNGINSTIFAYGQTSSGKTFTMRGVIENAIVDIYAFIDKNQDRDFILKISGLEIYNEVVRDLLNPESGALRLLDDPERGTIVEKLVETIVRDSKHLRQILSVCEAQRQVGETMLNDASSRSHQIIRLTVESTPRGVIPDGSVNTLSATLNFVDLAGSERASQTCTDGVRLKEGCHINRSLLTLSTVIRKLSGNRNKSGHIPYRDSKLTRILQLSLGGNARTAIICTMSPAHAHVEQSRNTLAFATRAKEVTNNARVNMVVSDKDLVKQLQKEVARLEAELRVPEAALSSEALLLAKEEQIQKMESEMQELVRQRDAAKAQLSEVLSKMGDEPKEPCTPTKKQLLVDELNPKSAAPFMLIQEIRKLEKLQDELGEDASRALEALQKEVECLRLAQVDMNQDAVQTITKLQAEIKNLHLHHAAGENEDSPHPVVDVSSPKVNSKTPSRRRRGLPPTLGSTNSSSRQLFANSPPCSPKTTMTTTMASRGTLQENNENTPPRSGSCENTPSSGHKRSSSVDIRKMQNMFKTAAEDNIKSIRAYVTELKERVAKLQYQKQLLVSQVLELESSNGDVLETGAQPSHSPAGWKLEFDKQRRQIVELWDLCQVSIIHRTQFHLLFKGDPADAMYMEVEFRRLLWLQEQFAKNEQQQSPSINDEENISSYAASCRALKREREMLAKRMRRLPPDMKDDLLMRWGIPMESKQRKLQLAEKIWTDAHDMQHVQDSAEVVALIVGFWEPGSASKEMFALNFAPPPSQKPFHLSWNSISSMLNL